MEIYIEQLKNYSPEDLTSINKLTKQLGDHADRISTADMKEIIKSKAVRLFVARRLNSKEIVGMLTMIVFRISFAKKGFLEDFVVDKKYRGIGIGAKLIKSATDKAKKLGVSYLDYTSRPTRLAANNLYNRLGFRKRDTNVYRIEL